MIVKVYTNGTKYSFEKKGEFKRKYTIEKKGSVMIIKLSETIYVVHHTGLTSIAGYCRLDNDHNLAVLCSKLSAIIRNQSKEFAIINLIIQIDDTANATIHRKIHPFN